MWLGTIFTVLMLFYWTFDKVILISFMLNLAMPLLCCILVHTIIKMDLSVNREFSDDLTA